MATEPLDEQTTALEALQRHWGHPGFRPGQWDVIGPVLAGQDVLAVLPTGAGKSVCYQVPALLREGLTLVISPLIALMQDQVAQLQSRGISATYINSTLAAHEVDQRWTDAEFGRYQLLYMAPERLTSELFVARVGRLKVSLLAVDEAHCISEWGHHFRPAYLKIAEARVLMGEVQTLAVTATATPEVRRDIRRHLALRSTVEVVKGFDRPNLVWSVFRDEDKRAKVMDVIRGVGGVGVIYAATRRGVETWAAWLGGQGVSARGYHGGMPAAEREAAQKAWLSGACAVMVATNAFGMGIDKANVRFVIHVDLPGTLEGYYQEAGRAGRDGRTAYVVLLFQDRDEQTQQALIEEGHPTAKAVRAVYDAVSNLGQIPLGALPDGPVRVDPAAVGKLAGTGTGLTKACIEQLVRQEVWQVLPPRKHHVQLRFEQSAAAVRNYVSNLNNQALATFIEGLLRTVHADAFSAWWPLDLRLLRRRTKLTQARITDGLDFLQGQGLLQWRPQGGVLQVIYLAPRTQRLPVDDRTVRQARRRAQAHLKDMLRYARSVTCRRHFLLSYFGESSPARCGRCDLCLGRHAPVVVTDAHEPAMRELLAVIAKGREPMQAAGHLLPGRDLEALLDWLMQEQYLEVAHPLEGPYVLTEKGRSLLQQWQPRSQT